MTMLGERVIEGVVYSVAWSGTADARGDCPSLLDDYPRGSTLTESVLAPIRRASTRAKYQHRVIRHERDPR